MPRATFAQKMVYACCVPHCALLNLATPQAKACPMPLTTIDDLLNYKAPIPSKRQDKIENNELKAYLQ